MLQSRGVLAGAGSAVSLIGAALVSLLLSAGLVAISAWPEAADSSISSVTVPAALPASAPATPAPVARSASAPAVVVAPAGALVAGRGAITVARPGAPGGSSSPAAASPAAAPSAVVQPEPAARPVSPLTGVTDKVSGITADTTARAGSAVGGEPGSVVQGAGEQVSDAIRQVGAAASDLLSP